MTRGARRWSWTNRKAEAPWFVLYRNKKTEPFERKAWSNDELRNLIQLYCDSCSDFRIVFNQSYISRQALSVCQFFHFS